MLVPDLQTRTSDSQSKAEVQGRVAKGTMIQLAHPHVPTRAGGCRLWLREVHTVWTGDQRSAAFSYPCGSSPGLCRIEMQTLPSAYTARTAALREPWYAMCGSLDHLWLWRVAL